MFTTDAAGMKKLNAHLADKAYVDGFALSKNDAALFMSLCMKKPELTGFAHVARWFKHMSTYTVAQLQALPGEVTAVACPCAGTCEAKGAAKAEAKPAAKDEDEVCFDMEDDDEDAEKEMAAMKAKKAAEAKPAKAKKQARSMIVFHIKPYGDDSDLAKVLRELPTKVVMEGLTWGVGEMQNHCFGLQILAMPCIIVDELVSADDVCELVCEAFEDDVQNCDIHSFNVMG